MSLPSKYPYYCGLLYTAERGLDHAVRNYVLSHRHELEGLAGETCLLFCVDDETESVGPGTRRLKGGEVYEVARQLKVALDALPAAVFFIRPKSTLKVTVRLAAFLPPQPRPEMLTAMFRVFAASMDAASGESHERARLEALRDELTRRQARLVEEFEWPRRQVRGFDVSLDRVAKGSSIASALSGLLAFAVS